MRRQNNQRLLHTQRQQNNQRQQNPETPRKTAMRHCTGAAAILFLLLFPGCEGDPVATDPDPTVQAEASASGMIQSMADFPTWRQGFEDGTSGWLGEEIAGAGGWCGMIEAVDGNASALAPSAGRHYATVSYGDCNEYWAEHGFAEGSGPYSPGAGYAGAFPASGYVMELDVYLDPAWTAENPFVYSVSFQLLDEVYPDNFRYLFVPVTNRGGMLEVAGRPVSEAGWYTFRHRFQDEDGHLAVEFELARHGKALFTMPASTTTFTAEDLSSFDASNVGNGYTWFVAIAPDLDLPIDEHRIRRGS